MKKLVIFSKSLDIKFFAFLKNTSNTGKYNSNSTKPMILNLRKRRYSTSTVNNGRLLQKNVVGLVIISPKPCNSGEWNDFFGQFLHEYALAGSLVGTTIILSILILSFDKPKPAEKPKEPKENKPASTTETKPTEGTAEEEEKSSKTKKIIIGIIVIIVVVGIIIWVTGGFGGFGGSGNSGDSGSGDTRKKANPQNSGSNNPNNPVNSGISITGNTTGSNNPVNPQDSGSGISITGNTTGSNNPVNPQDSGSGNILESWDPNNPEHRTKVSNLISAEKPRFLVVMEYDLVKQATNDPSNKLLMEFLMDYFVAGGDVRIDIFFEEVQRGRTSSETLKVIYEDMYMTIKDAGYFRELCEKGLSELSES
jgi:hypothetical protein